MTQHDGSESEPGIRERIGRGIRRLWEFVHEFHQGYSQVENMGPRRDERVESEDPSGDVTGPESVADVETRESTSDAASEEAR